jgi:hypothetical protein
VEHADHLALQRQMRALVADPEAVCRKHPEVGEYDQKI